MASGEIIVELDSPNNNNMLFRPLQRVLRGKFDPKRMNGDGKAKHAPVVPGLHIGVNPKTKVGRVYDPLKEEREYLRVRDGLKASHGWSDIIIVQEAIHNDIDVTTWLFWMKRMIENGTAHLITGSAPMLENLEGKPNTDMFSSPHAAGGNRPEPVAATMK